MILAHTLLLSALATSAPWSMVSLLRPLQTKAMAINDAESAAVLGQIRAASGTFQPLDLPDPCPPELVVPMRLGEAAVTLSLERVWLRTQGFRALIDKGGGQIEEIQAPLPTTYQGTVQEWPGSRVAASIESGRIRALVLGPEQIWSVQPLSDFIADMNGTVALRADQVQAPSGTCPTVAGPGAPPALLNRRPGAFGVPRGGVQWQAALAIDADVEYFQLHGSSEAATITDIEGVINAVNVVYERDCLMTHSISAIVVRTQEPDPYTFSDSGELLDQFRAEWNSNQQEIVRDSAHLFTGRDIDGTVIGRAYIGTYCHRDDSYGFSQARYTPTFSLRTSLVAHEIGHLLNARHCNNDTSSPCVGQSPCNIMCSAIGGCHGVGLPNFDPCSADVIRDYAASHPCFDVPVAVVWVDFTHAGSEDGSYARPYNTLAEGLAAVPTGGVLRFMAGATSATATVNRGMTLQAPLGPVTIGQ